MSAAVRRCDGFKRYALSVQYHGGSFLGFPFLGHQNEDCILADGTDLRGFRTVESRLREALDDCVGPTRWENIQVSSRTDRGVHALRNTLHVDIHASAGRSGSGSGGSQSADTAVVAGDEDIDRLIIRKLQRGINFHLSRQGCNWERTRDDQGDQLQQRSSNKRWRRQSSRQHEPPFTFLGQDNFARYSIMNEMRILSAAVAPTSMPNSQYALENFPDTEPEFVDWNARFSATQRIYIYRVLAYPSLSDSDVDNDDDDKFEIQDEFGMPFEWDRSWRVRGNDVNTMDYSNTGPLDVDAMRTAASLLEGTHDFSAFRAAKCQRHSPVVTLNEIQINSQPYGCVSNWLGPTLPNSGLLGLGSDPLEGYNKYQPTLLTIVIAGNSFLYRQVRNMVGCLVEVGRRRMEPTDVGNLLEAKQRSGAPSTAPSHGLYLVDVQHGKFKF